MRLSDKCLIRRHNEDGSHTDLGRCVWIDRSSDKYWWIPLPGEAVFKPKRKMKGATKDRNGAETRIRRKHFIKAVRQDSISGAEADEHLTFHQFDDPEIWTLTERELEEGTHDLLLSKTRRQLGKWKTKRDEQYALIEPIVKKLPGLELLLPRFVEPEIRLQQAAMGLKSPAPIVRALRMFILGDRKTIALLPRWDLINQNGVPKHAREHDDGKVHKQGRPNKSSQAGAAGVEGYILTPMCRERIKMGWKYFKTSSVSVETAWLMTLTKWWAKGVRYAEPFGVLPDFEELHDMPTIHQFRRHGPPNAASSAARINRGTHRFERNDRGLRGSARDGIVAAAQYAWIDATADDQNLVSSASRLTVISTPWNTKVMEGYTHYITGIHSGFEHPSAMTQLMAVANAASSKVEFCARFGIELKEGEWLSLHTTNLREDNGEGKAAMSIEELSRADITSEFVRSYAAELKGPVEKAHHTIARSSSHQVAASSQGRVRKRGDENPVKDACVTYAEYMPHFIRSILIHNNVAPVPQLLTDEMRQEGVKPTRAAILNWMLSKGYVTTEPPDMDQLRRKCLPRLKGTIQGNGVWVKDPRNERQYVKGLVYWSEELHETGWTARGRKEGKECYIHLNPSDLSQAWIGDGKLMRLELRHADPTRQAVTLLDWLRIQEKDKEIDSAEEKRRLEIKAGHVVAIAETNAEAKRARNVERKGAIGKPRPPAKTKRDATADELKHQHRVVLGVAEIESGEVDASSAGAATIATRPTQAPKRAASPLPKVDQDDDWMDEARQRRAA